MRFLGASIGALVVAALTAACSSSGDTGSSGGWRVSGAHIRVVSDSTPCRTPAPVVDTFFTPKPDPGCSPPAHHLLGAAATPSPTPRPTGWQAGGVQMYHSGSAQAWQPIYTKYTAPPGSGIYAPMVHATEQPMPTPFNTPTPTPMPTPSALPTYRPEPTQPPVVPTPAPSWVLPTPTPSS